MNQPPAPPKDQRRRGADHPRASPSPGRRRGCNCKKSGCLKLYCECFANNMRCGDRCQCQGCKNHEHNKLEIAHAMEAIEKRSQRAFKSPLAVARRLETMRTSTPQTSTHTHTHSHDQDASHSHHNHLQTPIHTAMDGATRLLMSAERLEEGTPYTSSTTAPMTESAAASSASGKPSSECICFLGACQASCPCHENFGGCGRRCACQHVPVEKNRGCSCKKSNCLKLYCECLAAQRVCDSRCNCEGCKNHYGNHEERERAIGIILERNPMAFQPKVASGASQHLRGCNCRKSNCMKNYCECHQAGVPCTSRCACQSCRNTDAFVSAKKMLIFSGDPKNSANSSSPDGTGHSHHHHHHHATTPAVGTTKPPRRPSRRASMDISSPSMQFRTPTSQLPSGLDMLSRTAPPASQQQQQYEAYTMGSSYAIVNKRKLSDLLAPPGNAQLALASEQHRKKLGKVPIARSSFQERLEKAAAASNDPQLPSVEALLDAELNSSLPDLPLTKLCRSLLNAARSVDVTPTPRKAERSPMLPRVSASPGLKGDESKQEDEPEYELNTASPMTDDLLCQEDIETPTRAHPTPTNSNTNANNNSTSPSGNGDVATSKDDDTEANHRAVNMRLAAMQERAVLQEFSVWLRNLTTSAVATNTAPQQ